MKALGCVLLLCFGGLSCARIYRPVTLVAPPPVATQSQGLSGALTAQPWGDNSRYKERALRANLRVVALSFENRSSDEWRCCAWSCPRVSRPSPLRPP